MGIIVSVSNRIGGQTIEKTILLNKDIYIYTYSTNIYYHFIWLPLFSPPSLAQHSLSFTGSLNYDGNHQQLFSIRFLFVGIEQVGNYIHRDWEDYGTVILCSNTSQSLEVAELEKDKF